MPRHRHPSLLSPPPDAFVVRTPAQLQALASAAALEIIGVLRSEGPGSVADLARSLGRSSHSLHYHVRRLWRAGLLVKTDQRRKANRYEAVYDLVAPRIAFQEGKDRKVFTYRVKVARTILRLAEREYRQAVYRQAGRNHPLPVASRYKGWLTPRDLARIRRHTRAIDRLFRLGNRRRKGKRCSFTFVVADVEP